MQTHLAALAHASVLQLRDALRRVSALHAPVAPSRCPAHAPAAEVLDAGKALGSEWEETTFDVRHLHA